MLAVLGLPLGLPLGPLVEPLVGEPEGPGRGVASLVRVEGGKNRDLFVGVVTFVRGNNVVVFLGRSLSGGTGLADGLASGHTSHGEGFAGCWS